MAFVRHIEHYITVLEYSIEFAYLSYENGMSVKLQSTHSIVAKCDEIVALEKLRNYLLCITGVIFFEVA